MKEKKIPEDFIENLYLKPLLYELNKEIKSPSLIKPIEELIMISFESTAEDISIDLMSKQEDFKLKKKIALLIGSEKYKHKKKMIYKVFLILPDPVSRKRKKLNFGELKDKRMCTYFPKNNQMNKKELFILTLLYILNPGVF